MNTLGDAWANLLEFARDNPMNAIAVVACSIALATTPVAFAFMAAQPWFQARRGRVMQRPSFAAVMVATLLTMGVPAILLAVLIKSMYFDRDRYEFDPNRIPSVLDQGRQYETRSLLESAYKADEAVRAERDRLAQERKALVEAVKKLDQAMLPLSEAALTIQATSDAMANVVPALAAVRKSVGVDAQPRWQELVAILNDPERRLQLIQAGPIAAATTGAARPTSPAALSLGPFESELSGVPAPQQALARLLPLNAVPGDWEVGDLSGKHIETFNAENLYEKINGRAESFTQYQVVGMAYSNFHPKTEPESGEVQLYIFEFSSGLNAFGKYGSEKSPDAQTIAIGTEGYTAAGSVSFYADKYFVQVVSTSDDPKFAAFSTSIAKLVAARISGEAPATNVAAQPDSKTVDPVALFQLLPAQPNRNQPQYVAQDAFGYSFLSDVFLADYKNDQATWQGFLRPYDSPAAAAAIFEKYLETVKADGAEIEDLKLAGATRGVVCGNIGLFDVLFLKGNSIAGVNGATKKEPAIEFARELASQLPESIPAPNIKPVAPKPGGEY